MASLLGIFFPSTPRSRRGLYCAASLCTTSIFFFFLWIYQYKYPDAPIRHLIPGDSGSTTGSQNVPIAHSELAPTTTGFANTMPTSVPGIGASTTNPTVKLKQGIYVGHVLAADMGRVPREVDAFLGIPYALSTAGQNRFRDPVPMPESGETFQAAKIGPLCPGTAQEPKLAYSEDCLNLNIYRAKQTVSDTHIAGLGMSWGL
jgi:hypothetical protein